MLIADTSVAARWTAIAGELKIDVYPYGAAKRCRFRQNIPRGLPQGGVNSEG